MIQSSLYLHLRQSKPPRLVAFSSQKEAQQAQDVALFLGYEPHLLADIRAHVGDDLRAYRDELFETFASLAAFYASHHPRKILFSPIRTLLLPLPVESLLQTFTLSFGDTLDLNELKERLFRSGYSFADVVQMQGEVSFRGDIIDIFPIGRNRPFRFSLFDIEIESIREFDVTTQVCGKEELEKVSIPPAYFSLDEESYQEMRRSIERDSSDLLLKDMQSLGLWHLGERGYFPLLDLKAVLSFEAKNELNEIYLLDEQAVPKEKIDSIESLKEPVAYQDIITKDPAAMIALHQDKKITVIANNEAVLKQHGISPESDGFTFVKSPVSVNILGAEMLILSLNQRVKAKKRPKANIILDELKNGEYIVHEEYGIGIFKGIESAEVLGAKRDFVSLHYQGGDKVLLPVENLDVIDRYIADSGSVPVLDKLGKGSFARLKGKVKEKLFAIAGEIIKMAARRELISGAGISSIHEELALFQKASGFTYTPDQQRSIEEICEDFQKNIVMDRLLSADVGFGKTEVAMNAVFLVVKSGFQALVMTPTTLLSHQHFLSMRARFGAFGIKMAKLDRFLSAKEKKEVLRRLEAGEVDVVVGTHGLLGAKCKNLGLTVIDEEHKFGVKQKEKIKELRENTHILSMSATPIPRTLNMALSSIKGMSQIMTPPSERLPIRTFVREFDEGVVKEAVLRELRRGGQVFYIYNNIATILNKQKELETMLPDVKTGILHSKVGSEESEKLMLDFSEGKYQMLISTSIVESGIHLPNVNTMLVENADRFGIADLHQLRGRVGRGNKEAFCLFLVEDKTALSDEAKRRLVALENNSFLGSGSVLAYHDLEIRGGGNLIGEAQSGHIKNIGYALYLRMLEDSINELSGKQAHHKREVDLKLSVSAYLSSDLIPGDRVRLELYRRLSKCENVVEVHEIEAEMIDRFGKLDVPTNQFLQLIMIKILAADRNIKTIMNYGQNITLVGENDHKMQFQSRSKDDDDILAAILETLRQ